MELSMTSTWILWRWLGVLEYVTPLMTLMPLISYCPIIFESSEFNFLLYYVIALASSFKGMGLIQDQRIMNPVWSYPAEYYALIFLLILSKWLLVCCLQMEDYRKRFWKEHWVFDSMVLLVPLVLQVRDMAVATRESSSSVQDENKLFTLIEKQT